MQSWEEFATKVLGNTEHTYELIKKQDGKAQNGAVIAFPKIRLDRSSGLVCEM